MGFSVRMGVSNSKQCPVIRRIFLLVSLLILIPAVLAQVSPDVNALGGEVYKQNCAVCHGDKGDGMTRVRRGLTPPPRDFTTMVAKAELSRERMLNSVTHGRPDTAMMSFSAQLNDAEISSVVGYIRDTFMLNDDVDVDETMIKLARGKEIYVSNCAVCHGDDGNGAMWTTSSLNPAPRDFTTPLARDELSRERMLTSVTHGRPNTAMMSFSKRFSGPEIESVVDYIRDTFFSSATDTASSPGQGLSSPHNSAVASVPEQKKKPENVADADMSLSLPNNLTGDLNQGREFYMSNCFTCHGRKGDGDGPRASFITPKPRNFLHSESRRTLNRPNLFKAIGMGKVGTVMPAWSKVLNDQQIANVAEFVFKTFIHPPDVEQIEPAAEVMGKKKVDS